MKPLVEQMGTYAAYHRNPVNKAIHFLFVPLIVWSVMGLLSLWGVPAPSLGLTVTPALVLSTFVLLYYLRLDLALGIAMVLLFTFLLGTAIEVVGLTSRAWLVFVAVFVVSWAAQLIGHRFFEHRKPALVDDLWQVFVSPIFIVAEWAFALGLRKELHEQVQQRVAASQ